MLLYIFILLFYCWVSTHVLWVSFGLLIRSIQSWIRHGIRGGMIIPTKKPSERRSLQYNKGKWKRGDSQVGIASYQTAPPASLKNGQSWYAGLRDFTKCQAWTRKGQVNTLIYIMTRKRCMTWSTRNLKLTFEAKEHDIPMGLIQPAETGGGWVHGQFYYFLVLSSNHCRYGTLQDEMIHDRIVVGLQDAAVSEKLRMDKDLTLDKAIAAARQRAVKSSMQ